MKYLIKLDRISAWVLFFSMLLYFITGYGLTKGLISPSFSQKIHLDWFPLIILFVFTFHTSFAIHLAFRRWNIWNNFSATVLVLFFLTFLSSFVYIDRFYNVKKVSSSENKNVDTSSLTTSQSAATSSEKTFTLSELAKYNGENGSPAYVAVDGVVYDLTSVFQNGTHFYHYAGQELTTAFYSQHIKSQISKYPVVGSLVK